MAMSGTITGSVTNKNVMTWNPVLGQWENLGDVYRFKPRWTATSNTTTRKVKITVSLRWERTNAAATFDTGSSKGYWLKIDGVTRSSGSKRFNASWSNNVYDAGSMSYEMDYNPDGTKTVTVQVYADGTAPDGTGPGVSTTPAVSITFDPITVGSVYYGAGGVWRKCLVYYGTGGTWKQVIPYYGTGGNWKQLG